MLPFPRVGKRPRGPWGCPWHQCPACPTLGGEPEFCRGSQRLHSLYPASGHGWHALSLPTAKWIMQPLVGDSEPGAQPPASRASTPTKHLHNSEQATSPPRDSVPLAVQRDNNRFYLMGCWTVSRVTTNSKHLAQGPALGGRRRADAVRVGVIPAGAGPSVRSAVALPGLPVSRPSQRPCVWAKPTSANHRTLFANHALRGGGCLRGPSLRTSCLLCKRDRIQSKAPPEHRDVCRAVTMRTASLCPVDLAGSHVHPLWGTAGAWPALATRPRGEHAQTAQPETRLLPDAPPGGAARARGEPCADSWTAGMLGPPSCPGHTSTLALRPTDAR